MPNQYTTGRLAPTKFEFDSTDDLRLIRDSLVFRDEYLCQCAAQLEKNCWDETKQSPQEVQERFVEIPAIAQQRQNLAVLIRQMCSAVAERQRIGEEIETTRIRNQAIAL